MKNLEKLLQQAIENYSNGNEEQSIELYHAILRQKEDWSKPNYNLGLIHKYRNEWQESYKYNKRAAELDPTDEAAWWNLGIAATMTYDWLTARKAWNFFGMNYDLIDKDPSGNIGITPIRINPNDEAEVIWSVRIDPARARLENIPYPESNHRYGDIVLNDGAPNGYRTWNGQEYAVLDELQHLIKSNYKTFSIKCIIGEKQLELLKQMCKAHDVHTENWTTSVRLLCKQCSEGKPHDTHDENLKTYKKYNESLIAFASTSEEELTRILNSWSKDTSIAFYEYRFY